MKKGITRVVSDAVTFFILSVIVCMPPLLDPGTSAHSPVRFGDESHRHLQLAVAQLSCSTKDVEPENGVTTHST
ncbi:hypothetical protein HDV57DRAFT_461976 [Trichoderma longibrachiatum]